MEKIRIITESASDMGTPEREDVTVLPMHITFGEKEYLDGVNLSHQEFYNMLIESDELPKTSLISPGTFADEFEKAEKAGEQVVDTVEVPYGGSLAFGHLPERHGGGCRLRQCDCGGFRERGCG